MKINWKVRIKNPVFWANIMMAIMAPVLVHLGINWEEVTTWAKLFEILAQAVSNPAICTAVIVSVWNAVNDPTTAGVSDSDRALTYNEPRA
ncbi:MAG: phage holin [Clostridia bacterium]|nr:phage holin [Clostridia bacterium]